MANTFASGGYIRAGNNSVTTTSGGSMYLLGNSGNLTVSTKKATQSLRLLNLTWKKNNPELCCKRRGGPRSEVFCEVPVAVPHTVHSGRKNTRWFSWEDKS